jgi:hypothetical protein
MYTLYEILTMLKIIICHNDLFDETIPAIIREDPPFATALGRRELHEIRDIVLRQLVPRLVTWWSQEARISRVTALAGPGTEATLESRVSVARPEVATVKSLILA